MNNIKSSDRVQIVGVMSGTSLDGLDIALCSFERKGPGSYGYTIMDAETIGYDQTWRSGLADAHELSAEELRILDIRYGQWIGEKVAEFLNSRSLTADLIASHGHTVLHDPEKGITLQIGHGAEIAVAAKLDVVNDFRTQDVKMGGQGAPLVPIGDRMLFGNYYACVNLGGFANISLEKMDQRIAFDICPVNIVLNEWSQKLGHPYDEEGRLARSGVLNTDLYDRLNRLSYYDLPHPKSLGREWVQAQITPLLADHDPLEVLRTFSEHAAYQISSTFHERKSHDILFSGGGVYNRYLMEMVQKRTEARIVIPDPLLIEYKEALIFALLGYLRILEIPNVLSSVTGSTADHSSGRLWKTGDKKMF